MNEALAAEALAAWPNHAASARLVPITTGLINQSFRVETPSGERFALQRLAPIFGAEVHEDIARVTAHLAARGMVTPHLIPPEIGPAGALDVRLPGEGGLWRLMTWIEGHCLDRLDGVPRAWEAGHLLGRFHRALSDFEAPFAHVRLGIHDTPAHLGALRAALGSVGSEPEDARTSRVGETIEDLASRLPPLPPFTPKVAHGDPKISNLIFSSEGRGRALIDLDTVARMALPLELGDAFRSWCNPSREDDDQPHFDLELFEAALRGYAQSAGAELTRDEVSSLVTATRTVVVGLSARFCRDAIEDRYFGWDPKRYPSRRAHNLARAESQVALARNLERQSPAAEQRVAQVFSTP